MKNSYLTHLFSGLVLLLVSVSTIQAQSTGSISGTVLNAENERSLQGANITLEGTRLGTATQEGGRFRIRQVPNGTYNLVVRYVGYQTKTKEVTIESGQNLNLTLLLQNDFIEGQDVVVTAVQDGQARAFNIQRNDSRIINVVSTEQLERFADPNISGSLRRVPGLSYQTDRGEAGEVYIRGLSPSISNVTVNGSQLASTDDDGREVWLGGITSDIVTNLEVIKAITPDMDANTIGGTINMDTYQNVGAEPIIRGNVSGGINQLSDGGQFQTGIQYGQRFGDFQFFVTGSYQANNRQTHDLRKEYGNFDFGDGSESFRNVMDEQRLSVYTIPRKRYGATAQLDYDFNPRNSIYLRTMFNTFDDSQIRDQHRIVLDREDYIDRNTAPGARFQVDGRTFERKLSSYSAVLGGDSQVNNWGISYKAAYSRGTYREPFRNYLRFRRNEGVDVRYDDQNEFYFPQVWATDGSNVNDPNNYEFTYYEERKENADDNDFSASIDFETPLEIGNTRVDLKFGGLARYKDKDRQFTRERYDYDGDFTLARVSTNNPNTFINRYNQFAPSPDWDKASGIFERERNLFSLDRERAFEENTFYEINETDLAAYAMSTFNFDRLTIIAGARLEHIQGNYRGSVKELRLDADENPIFGDEEIVEGSNSLTNIFPQIHFRYGLTDRTNIRLAYTQTYARPIFADLAPNRVLIEDDEEIFEGNPNLRPLLSDNIDFMVEYFFTNVGVLSGGLFYKDITDFVFTEAREITDGEFAGFVERQPVNGEAAKVYGAEIAWQQQLDFLPSALSGLGIYANYTYTFTEAEITGMEERTISLPESVPHVFNGALSYTYGGFFAQLSANYQHDWIDEVASNPADDRWRDRVLTFDASASQRITPNITAFADIQNITNQGTGEYYGARGNQLHRGRSIDFHGWWANLGVRLRM